MAIFVFIFFNSLFYGILTVFFNSAFINEGGRPHILDLFPNRHPAKSADCRNRGWRAGLRQGMPKDKERGQQR